MIQIITLNNRMKEATFSGAVEQMAHLFNRGHECSVVIDDCGDVETFHTLMKAISHLYMSKGYQHHNYDDIVIVTLKENCI